MVLLKESWVWEGEGGHSELKGFRNNHTYVSTKLKGNFISHWSKYGSIEPDRIPYSTFHKLLHIFAWIFLFWLLFYSFIEMELHNCCIKCFIFSSCGYYQFIFVGISVTAKEKHHKLMIWLSVLSIYSSVTESLYYSHRAYNAARQTVSETSWLTCSTLREKMWMCSVYSCVENIHL